MQYVTIKGYYEGHPIEQESTTQLYRTAIDGHTYTYAKTIPKLIKQLNTHQ